MSHTPGPWFVSGVRFRMNGSEWHSVNRYDEKLKRDEGIACVGFDPRTGLGLSDARLIAAAPQLLDALKVAEKQFGGLAVITVNGKHNEGDVRCIEAMRDAIAKAEAKSHD